MRNWVIRLSVILATAPIVVAVAWYTTSFLPYASELQDIAAEGNEEVSAMIATLYPLAVAGESTEGIRTHAMRQAYRSLVYSKTRQRMLRWHLNNALWNVASHLHFDEKEVFGLWARCVFGCGKGLSYVAREYLEKDMTELSCRELAMLVAMVRNPIGFRRGSDYYQERTEAILEKATAQDAVPRLSGNNGDCLN